MGMTIDVAKLNLSAIQKYYNEDLQDCYVYVGFDEEDNETVNFAIEIMCKYQKIEEIVKKSYKNGICYEGCDDWFNKLTAIRKVLEDDEKTEEKT